MYKLFEPPTELLLRIEELTNQLVDTKREEDHWLVENIFFSEKYTISLFIYSSALYKTNRIHINWMEHYWQ